MRLIDHRPGRWLLLLPLVLSCSTGTESVDSPGDLAGMIPSRTVAPRLSIPTPHRRCPESAPPGGTILQMRCPGAGQDVAPSGKVPRLRTPPRRGAGPADSPEALHLAALVDLLWADSAGISLSTSISSLESTSWPAGRSAGVLVDLSAAYLVRAERTQSARDLLVAADVARQALAVEPRNPTARFNLALALDRYGLHGQAAEAWEQYLMVDSGSGWAQEARDRVRALAARPVPPPPTSGAAMAEVDAYVAQATQEARLHGWDRLLGEWGDAVLEGDTLRAGDRLRLAEALGGALERRGRDATLADAVRTIRARSGDRAATRTLAQAHREYAAGQTDYFELDHASARARFARVLKLRPASPPLERWATAFHAMMLVHAYEFGAAERLLRPLISSADTLRHPALAGRARWVLATALLRRGGHEEARDTARVAARLLARAGEHEHLGGAEYVAADAQFYLGATLAAHDAAQRALATLRRHRRSVWLLNALAAAAKTAEADGLVQAATRLQDERVVLADSIGERVRIAEARLARARVLAAAGMLDRARVDVEASEPLVQGLKGGARAWFGTELRLARAALSAHGDPRRAAAILDSVLAKEDSLIAPRRLRARVGRAEARLASGDPAGAMADLDAASVLLATQHDSIGRSELRASLLDAARGVFERLAMLRVRAADTTGALRFLERGRASFGPTGRGASRRDEGRWRLPRGETAVDYALVGDTLLVWTVAGARVHLTRSTVDRAALVRSIEDVRSSLERGVSGDTLRPALAALYDRLVRPVEGRLGGDDTPLVLIADGELSAVPFSALYDASARRYLAQAHPLRYAGSLRDASRVRAAAPGGATEALLVADPAFDARANPGLSRLPGARAEVGSIAAGYRTRTVLADSGAGRGALVAALDGADVVHFAGHAVFDDQRPERSYLVLAPERGAPDPGWLTAAEMEDLPVGHVDVFVLSACRTLRSRSGRSGGFAGFAGALLDAGAGGVVGSLWEVDDRLTAPLMVEFHRAYRRSGDGPRALREAQLQLLRSPNPALRSPSAWAGFRYAGN